MFSPGMGWRWEFGETEDEGFRKKMCWDFRLFIPFYSGKFPLNHYLENMFLVFFEAF